MEWSYFSTFHALPTYSTQSLRRLCVARCTSAKSGAGHEASYSVCGCRGTRTQAFKRICLVPALHATCYTLNDVKRRTIVLSALESVVSSELRPGVGSVCDADGLDFCFELRLTSRVSGRFVVMACCVALKVGFRGSVRQPVLRVWLMPYCN